MHFIRSNRLCTIIRGYNDIIYRIKHNSFDGSNFLIKRAVGLKIATVVNKTNEISVLRIVTPKILNPASYAKWLEHRVSYREQCRNNNLSCDRKSSSLIPRTSLIFS